MSTRFKSPGYLLSLICNILLVLAIFSSSSTAAKFVARRLLVGQDESDNYAVIFDGGSSGSRVHVFRFDSSLNLINIGNVFDVYEKIKPGLSSYADDPQAAADSLIPLLEIAEDVIPEELQSKTPVRLGATAGLRLLEGDASEKILEAVRNLIKTKSNLRYKPEWISVLAGTDEGAYLWAAINYLLGSLGKEYPNTVCTIDLGGGSVQMSYAVSNEVAANAPKTNEGEAYVLDKNLMGTKYNLYTHSYLNYGLFAARAGILKLSRNSTNPCILSGYHGTYTYNGESYKASALPSGPNMRKCRQLIRKFLKLEAACEHKDCTFNGVWNGGGGPGQKTMYAASNFYDVAAQVGIVDQSAKTALSRPNSFNNAAKFACATKYENAKSTFPNAYEAEVQFLCMDLIYEYTLLVDGFGLNPLQQITLVTQIKYKGTLLEAAWPLGSAIDLVSVDDKVKSISLSNTLSI